MQALSHFNRNLLHLALRLSYQGNEINLERVQIILSILKGLKLRNLKGVLEHYHSKIAAILRNQTIFIAYGNPLPQSDLESLRKQFSSQMNTNLKLKASEKKSLIAGISVQIGDNLWDASLTNYLNQLSESF